MIQIYKVYKSSFLSILFFIINASLINAQPRQQSWDEEQFSIDNTCNIKIYPPLETSLLNKKERRKIKLLLCNHLDIVQFIDSVFNQYRLPNSFSSIPLLCSYSNNKSPEKFGKGIWNLNYITALNYGLVMNHFIDERLDYKKATIVAAKELNRLWEIFAEKESTLIAFLISPNYVFNKEIWTHSPNQFFEDFDLLLKIDSFSYSNKTPTITNVNQSFFTFSKNLSFDAIYEYKSVDFNLILENNKALISNVLPMNYPILLNKEDGDFLKENEITISKFQDSLYANLFFKNDFFEQEKLHIVEAGDVLGKIALIYNVTVRDLMDWNDLNSTIIYLGQTLVVGRMQSIDGHETSIFQDGLSLQFWEIAKQYGYTVREISELNRYETQNTQIKLKKKNP